MVHRKHWLLHTDCLLCISSRWAPRHMWLWPILCTRALVFVFISEYDDSLTIVLSVNMMIHWPYALWEKNVLDTYTHLYTWIQPATLLYQLTGWQPCYVNHRHTPSCSPQRFIWSFNIIMSGGVLGWIPPPPYSSILSNGINNEQAVQGCNTDSSSITNH